jgi:hypothetical protein
MNTTITINVVETNGTIDQSAMEKDFMAQMHALKTEQVAGAVACIFDGFRGKRINLPDLSMMVLMKLQLTPSEYASWRPVADSYVRAHCKGEESLFVMGKGREGGVARRSDLKVTVQGEREAA